MNEDLEEIYVDICREIMNTKQRSTGHDCESHADVDAGDDRSIELKNRLKILKEIRDQLETLF